MYRNNRQSAIDVRDFRILNFGNSFVGERVFCAQTPVIDHSAFKGQEANKATALGPSFYGPKGSMRALFTRPYATLIRHPEISAVSL